MFLKTTVMVLHKLYPLRLSNYHFAFIMKMICKTHRNSIFPKS